MYTVKKGKRFSRHQLFPARESLVSNIPAGNGKIANLFLQCNWYWWKWEAFFHVIRIIIRKKSHEMNIFWKVYKIKSAKVWMLYRRSSGACSGSKIATLGHLKRVTESNCIQASKKLVFDFLTIQNFSWNKTSNKIFTSENYPINSVLKRRYIYMYSPSFTVQPSSYLFYW